MSSIEEEDPSDFEEIVKHRLVTVITREYIDLLRALLVKSSYRKVEELSPEEGDSLMEEAPESNGKETNGNVSEITET